MPQPREATVRRLIIVASEALEKELETLDASGAEVISAYLTMGRNACQAAIKHGYPTEALVNMLRRTILEISEPKGSVT